MNQEPPAPPPPSVPPPPPPPAAPPPGGAGGGGARLPWEDRQELGFVDALVATVRLLVTAPADAFSRLRADGDYVSPILFGVILSVIGQLFAQFWSLLVGAAWTSMLGQGMGDMAWMGGGGIASVLVVLIVTPIFYVIMLFIMAGIYHLCLMLLGAVEGSAFEGTLKIVAYASVAGLGNVIPLVGSLLVLVATIILLVIGFTTVHRIDQVKATIAALIPLVLCCLCIIGGAMLFGVSMAALAGAAGG